MTRQQDNTTAIAAAYSRQRLHYLLPGLGLALLSTPLSAMADVVNVSPTVQSAAQPLELPPELRAAGKWQAFRALWQALDAVAPSQPQATTPDGSQIIPISNALIDGRWPALPGYEQRAYYQALDGQEAARRQDALRRIFGDNITSAEAKLLYRLTQLRIQELSSAQRVTGDYERMNGLETMCRAMPPACSVFRLAPVPPSLYMVNAIDRISLRTKTLMSLRDKGAVGDEAFAAALNDLQQDAHLVLYLDALAGADRRPDFNGNPPARVLLDPTDFTRQPDLRRVQVWQGAVETACGGRDKNIISTDAASPQQCAQGLLQDLAALRALWRRLDPLLVELER